MKCSFHDTERGIYVLSVRTFVKTRDFLNVCQDLKMNHQCKLVDVAAEVDPPVQDVCMQLCHFKIICVFKITMAGVSNFLAEQEEYSEH